MRKTLLASFLLAAVGFGAWSFLAPAPGPKNPMERMKTASPLETVRAPKTFGPAPPPPLLPRRPDRTSEQKCVNCISAGWESSDESSDEEYREIQSIPYGYYWRESVLWIIHMRSRNNN